MFALSIITHRIAMQCGDNIVKGDIVIVARLARWSTVQKYEYNLDAQWCDILHIMKYATMCNKVFEIIKSVIYLHTLNARSSN
jgi:hypothetical protein